MGAAVAELTGLSVSYGHRPVLAGVDLRIGAGELVTIVGPSGAGKSTLLRVLAGLHSHDGGAVRRPEDDGGSTRTVFQEPHLLPWRTVERNVRLGLEYRANHRPGAAVARERVAQVLADLGIAELAGRYPHQLSGGQAQRVAVARAVVTRPSLLLLDEPFGALDPLSRSGAQDWLLGLRASLDTAMVLVTHDLDEALYLGDRVAVLRPGARGLELLTSSVHERSDLADGRQRALLLEHFTTPREPERSGTGIAEASSAVAHSLGDLDEASEPSGPDALGTPPAQEETTAAEAPGGRSRRQVLRAGGAAALLSVPAVAGATVSWREQHAGQSADSAVDLGSLQVGYLPITDASPLLLAQSNGEFDARGITAHTTLFRGWSPLVEALQGGQVDMVHLLMPAAVQLRYGAGVPVKVLGWNHTDGSAVAVDKDVEDITDLAGTTFAVPGWYSIHNIVFQKLLRAAGLEPVINTPPGPQTVQLVVLPPADMPTALRAGSVSGYIVAEPFCALAEVQGIGKILRFTGDVWKDHACCVTVVAEKFLQDQPDLATAALEAVVATQLRIREDRHGAAVALSEGGYLPQPRPAIEKTLAAEQDPAYLRSGAIEHPQWHSPRIGFQPFAYPGYTEALVDSMRETLVDDSLDWLDEVDTSTVHQDLVATEVNSRAIEAAGGLAAFGLPRHREEVIDP